jgi:hypothetical protein
MDKKSSIVWYYILVAFFSIKIIDALSCPDGWKIRTKYNGDKDISRCYQVFRAFKMTAFEVQLACFSMNSHLAEIEDQDELNFVSSNLLAVNGNSQYNVFWASLK